MPSKLETRTVSTRASTKKAKLEAQEKLRAQRKKEANLLNEFLKSHKKAPVEQLQYDDLCAFDDLLTDCFIDHVCALCFVSLYDSNDF